MEKLTVPVVSTNTYQLPAAEGALHPCLKGLDRGIDSGYQLPI
jgi:hypothetical protein